MILTAQVDPMARDRLNPMVPVFKTVNVIENDEHFLIQVTALVPTHQGFPAGRARLWQGRQGD